MRTFRWWLAILWLVPVALGMARLRFDAEILNLLPEKLAVAQGLKVYQRYFSDARELVITVEAPTAEEAEAAARVLAAILQSRTNLVAEVTWQPAWKENPAEAAELVASIWLNQPPEIFSELTNRLAVTNLTNVLAETRERLATSFSPSEVGLRGYDPYGLMRLPESVSGAASPMGAEEEMFATFDGTFRLMFVEAKPDLASYEACRSWLAAIQRVIGEARVSESFPKGAQVHFTGRPAFVTEIAGGMENDLKWSAGGTLAMIGLLFWMTYRRLRPLFWLLFVLLVVLAGTTAFGGLFFGTINVVSMGFASILLGLSEDYGIVIYQEARTHPELDASQLRTKVSPGILWSAVTTAGAFLLLNMSVLPGLGQLGSLVAIGILLSAVVMIYVYLPPLLRLRQERDIGNRPEASTERLLLFPSRRVLPSSVIWLLTLLLLIAAVGLLWRHGVGMDRSSDVLKPKASAARAALERIESRFGRTAEPVWVLVPGRDEGEVASRLVDVNRVLSEVMPAGDGFTLPTALWPQPEHQQVNRAAIAPLLQARESLLAAAIKAGFTSHSLVTTGSVLDSWERAASRTNVFWPTNRASHWILRKVAAFPTNGFLALGLIQPTTDAGVKKLVAEWPSELGRQGIILSGWGLLGSTVFDMVVRELPRLLIPIFLLVVTSLWLAFRDVREVVLSLVTLGFSGLLLAATMGVLGWDWNILNLMALPLLLGMGVDFSIHIQLALRGHGGDRQVVHRSMGRALLLAGATTVAGFASLGFSTNLGMASLGQVCALGISLALVVAVYLLPAWWKAWAHVFIGDKSGGNQKP